MKKVCKECGLNFYVSDKDLEFLDKVAPIILGKKHDVPAPNCCYECRLQRRFSWRNDITLYSRKCDRTGVNLISMFSLDSDVTVFEHDLWWSDKWDARDYGRNFDFDRPFFEQFIEVDRAVPHANVIVFNSENSVYTNYNTNVRNCYLCFAGNYSEDNLYCYNAEVSHDCVDCAFVWDSEILYDCVQCSKCYRCSYCLHSDNCSESMFLDDCIGCGNCFMSANLRNKQYYILNKKYSKEEYENKLGEYLALGHEECKKIWKTERKKFSVRGNHNLQSENCSGEYILQSKNCKDCYIVSRGGEDCHYVYNGFPNLKDASDCTFCGEKAELLYECLASGVNESRILFGNLCLDGSSDLLYCSCMFGCKNCFGCSNMRKVKYCILNKQYSEEEYNELVPKIISHMKETGEWGEYFPVAISPFKYNESCAGLHFPLSREEILNKGWQWKEMKEEVSGEPSGKVQVCEKSGKHFRFIKKELDFYEKWELPLPKLCFFERHKQRLGLMNGWHVRELGCVKCGKNVLTGNRSEEVYCEECYLGVVD